MGERDKCKNHILTSSDKSFSHSCLFLCLPWHSLLNTSCSGCLIQKLNAIEGIFCNRKGRKRTQRSRSSCLGLGRRKNPIPKSIGKSWELGKRHSKFVQYRMRFLAICNRVVSWLAPRTISNKELLKRYKNSFPRFSTGYPKELPNIQKYIQKD